MYLAGRTEQEIEATTFDEEGEAVGPLAGQPLVPVSGHGGGGGGGHHHSGSGGGHHRHHGQFHGGSGGSGSSIAR